MISNSSSFSSIIHAPWALPHALQSVHGISHPCILTHSTLKANLPLMAWSELVALWKMLSLTFKEAYISTHGDIHLLRPALGLRSVENAFPGRPRARCRRAMLAGCVFAETGEWQWLDHERVDGCKGWDLGEGLGGDAQREFPDLVP